MLIDVHTQSLPTANMCSRTAPCVRCLLVNTSMGNSRMAALEMRKKSHFCTSCHFPWKSKGWLECVGNRI